MDKLPTVNKVETGANIRRILRLNHMSISQLQMELKMTSATQIYSWCRGDYMPSIDRLVQMSRLFNCKVEDLLVMEEHP